MDRKLDARLRRISVSNRLLRSFAFAATRVRMEKTRSASETESVPSAESLRPVNGNVSGPRWHWLLRLTRHTWFTSGSTSRAIVPGSLPKMRHLLPVGRFDDVADRLGDVVERLHRDDRAELLLLKHPHLRRQRRDHGGREQGPVRGAAAGVDDARAAGDRVGHHRAQVVHLAGFRQRRDRHALVPRHADAQGGDRGGQPLEELARHPPVDEEDLERGAALPVERQRSEQALAHRQVEVGVREHDRRVLRLEPEHAAQAVRARMRLLQGIGGLAAADERQHVDLA